MMAVTVCDVEGCRFSISMVVAQKIYRYFPQGISGVACPVTSAIVNRDETEILLLVSLVIVGLILSGDIYLLSELCR
jgi:hypothetical protein